ncbi:15-hydroxyprostaglandin dehydrogenase [NAD(+)]-like [Tachypleus tridentatus]|uniref:15-hydroxyprostaglandin dehydrogenase [NAD(+)]-like n=1 Tax=Tachypleus tridentatus TaxID=6853 RepID=UPI003FD11AB5
MELTNKVVIVTGGAQGLGEAICESFLKRKNKVCVADVNNDKGLKTVENFNSRFGAGSAIYTSCDVSKESDFQDLFERTISIFGRVDILVNNAGIGGENNWRKVIEVDLMGVISGTKLAFKFMGTENGGIGGAVVNIASTAGLVPVPFGPIYCACKHGVVGYTRSMGTELYHSKSGVTVSAICPSFINTEMTRQMENLSVFQQQTKKFKESLQLMEPSYVAEALIYLLESKNINGTVLKVTKEGGYQYVL